MGIMVVRSNTENHYIISDNAKETVIFALNEQEALDKYNYSTIETVEQVVMAKWATIRYQRELFMRQTDWTQIIDVPLTSEKKAEFTAYRQALRDIPQTYDNPDDIVWPMKPTI